jgi:YfiH family protein
MILRSELLLSVPGIEHGFGTRPEPIPAFFQNSPAKPQWKQVHGIACAEVGTPSQAVGEVDGLFTRLPASPIAVVTADCVPVLLARRDGAAVAAVHAGWRGTAAKILSALWNQLRSQGEKPADWVAAIGPAIGPCCYEVSVELAQQFEREFATLGPHVAVPRFRHLDLPAVNAGALKQLGIGDVEILRHCTLCSKEPEFFSYRRKPTEGRQYSAIGRR